MEHSHSGIEKGSSPNGCHKVGGSQLTKMSLYTVILTMEIPEFHHFAHVLDVMVKFPQTFDHIAYYYYFVCVLASGSSIKDPPSSTE